MTAYYVEATGDTQILDETVTVPAGAALLTAEQEDMYGTPIVTGRTGHGLRALLAGNRARHNGWARTACR